MGFSFKIGKGDKMEYLLGGALALIIVFALAMTVWKVFGNPNRIPIAKEMHFKCLNPACNNEMAFKTREVPEEYRRLAGEVPFGKCPQCNKISVVQMDLCPKCGTPYVSTFRRMGSDGMRLVNINAKDICPNPKCGVDIQQYNKEHPQK